MSSLGSNLAFCSTKMMSDKRLSQLPLVGDSRHFGIQRGSLLKFPVLRTNQLFVASAETLKPIHRDPQRSTEIRRDPLMAY